MPSANAGLNDRLLFRMAGKLRRNKFQPRIDVKYANQRPYAGDYS